MNTKNILQSVGLALDGLNVAACLFDAEDRCVIWNASFLHLFPEHQDHVFEGEPYAENLRRFYQSRLSKEELPHIEQYIDAGVKRHKVQMRPFSFEHLGRHIEVSSVPLDNGYRLRVWSSRTVLDALEPRDSLSPHEISQALIAGHFSILDILPDGMMICDSEGTINWVNESFLSMYDLRDKSEAVGSNFVSIFVKVWKNRGSALPYQADKGLCELKERLRLAGAPFELPLPGNRYVRVIARTSSPNEIFYTHVDISELELQKKLLLQAQQELLKQALEKNAATEDLMLGALQALALERDNETGNHIIRTQQYVKLLAQRLRSMGLHTQVLSDAYIEMLYKAAPLHDVGKVGIPDRILNKPDRLTAEEWLVMKTHTTIGESVLTSTMPASTQVDNIISISIQIAGGHHERWDGTGYPRGLRENEIPLAARIMSVADVYDALVSERVYKHGWTHQQALTAILAEKGKQFDPEVVQALLLEADTFERIAQQLKD